MSPGPPLHGLSLGISKRYDLANHWGQDSRMRLSSDWVKPPEPKRAPDL